MKLAATLLVLALAATGVWAAEQEPTEEEKTILALVLKHEHRYTDHGYTVINPKTSLGPLDKKDAWEIRNSKRYITERLESNGIAVGELVDRLFTRNRKAVHLTLKSSRRNSYVIDCDGKYKKYFEENGGGWERWYRENPKAYRSTTVSLPVCDQKTRLVLVYTGTVSHQSAGDGWVILYRYEKGKLKELNSVMIWVS
ncbi:MAG TPA: hypothetical protein PKM43_19420 [Verrucomicrobiota bacterium]|nr:hypothetical protein [Verrucomicrobiota bacterium]HRZ55345.1 hypothetical protein [Candidatus Paceibacterota bacterium]